MASQEEEVQSLVAEEKLQIVALKSQRRGGPGVGEDVWPDWGEISVTRGWTPPI